MDLSQKYVKMCYKAQEIQKLCKWDMAHNFFGFAAYDFFGSVAYEEKFLFRTVWLPRQDQLLEILLKDNEDALIEWKLEYIQLPNAPCLKSYSFEIEFNREKKVFGHDTPEKVILKGVMWALYGKIWQLYEGEGKWVDKKFERMGWDSKTGKWTYADSATDPNEQ